MILKEVKDFIEENLSMSFKFAKKEIYSKWINNLRKLAISMYNKLIHSLEASECVKSPKKTQNPKNIVKPDKYEESEIITQLPKAFKNYAHSYNVKALDSKDPTMLNDTKSYVKNNFKNFFEK